MNLLLLSSLTTQVGYSAMPDVQTDTWPEINQPVSDPFGSITVQQNALSFSDSAASVITGNGSSFLTQAAVTPPDNLWMEPWMSDFINSNPPLEFFDNNTSLMLDSSSMDPLDLFTPHALPTPEVTFQHDADTVLPSHAHTEDVDLGLFHQHGAMTSAVPTRCPSPVSGPSRPKQQDVSHSISVAEHSIICQSIASAFPSRSGLVLPTQYGMSRYVKGFMNGYHRHFPMIHKPTFQIAKVGTLLQLSILSLGAQYALESAVASRLYELAKELVGRSRSADAKKTSNTQDMVETLQSRIFMACYGTWCVDEGLHHEALANQSVLANVGVLHSPNFKFSLTLVCHQLARKLASKEDESSSVTEGEDDDKWESWIASERIRRFVVFEY